MQVAHDGYFLACGHADLVKGLNTVHITACLLYQFEHLLRVQYLVVATILEEPVKEGNAFLAARVCIRETSGDFKVALCLVHGCRGRAGSAVHVRKHAVHARIAHIRHVAGGLSKRPRWDVFEGCKEGDFGLVLRRIDEAGDVYNLFRYHA